MIYECKIGKHTIKVVERPSDFMAYIDDDNAKWESSRVSVAEAVGKLVMSYHVELGK